MIDLFILYLNYINLYIESNFYIALIIYFLVSFFIFFFSIPGSALIIIASAFFLDIYYAFLINILSISLGSLFFIILSKKILNKYFDKYINKYFYVFEKIIKKSSLEYLILLRLIIGPPLFVQNIFLATLNVSSMSIFFSTIIGFTPYFILYVIIGNQISNLQSINNITFWNIISLEFFVILSALAVFLIFRIYLKSKNK